PDYLAAKATQEQRRLALGREMKGFDALLTLPAFGEAPHGLHYTGDAEYCAPWTLSGHQPSRCRPALANTACRSGFRSLAIIATICAYSGPRNGLKQSWPSIPACRSSPCRKVSFPGGSSTLPGSFDRQRRCAVVEAIRQAIQAWNPDHGIIDEDEQLAAAGRLDVLLDDRVCRIGLLEVFFSAHATKSITDAEPVLG